MPLPPDPEADAIDVSSLTEPTTPGTPEFRALVRHRQSELAAQFGIDPQLVVISGADDTEQARRVRRRAAKKEKRRRA